MINRRLPVLLFIVAILAASCATQRDATVDATPAAEVDNVASQALPTQSIIGRSVADIELPDASNDGAAFALSAKDDGVLLVYFGFTFCPDVCPTTLADLRTALASMGEAAESVDVSMVTVDPDRDTPEVLATYIEHFIEGGHALRTDDTELLKAAGDAFGASFDVIKLDDGRIDVLHSAYIYAVDDQGVIVASWPFGAEPDTIVADLTAFLSG
ncbi:MAG: SCO family protein [Actinomycetota bacterium]